MIRITSSKVNLKLLSTNNQIRQIASLKSVKKGLFEELFPLATKIDPTTNSFIAIEPIEGSNVEGTIFTNKNQGFASIYNDPIKAKTTKKKEVSVEKKIENLVSMETQYQIFDQIGRDANLFREENENDNEYGVFNYDGFENGIYGGYKESEYMYSEEEFLEQLEEQKRKVFSKAMLQESLDEYIEHYLQHHEKPNHMSFIITETPRTSKDEIVNGIQRIIDLPISSIIINKSFDRTSFGKDISSFVSVILNSENDDFSVDTELYYNRFANFGITLDGIRHHVVKSKGLKTIEMKLSQDVEQKELKDELIKQFKDQVKGIENIKISLSDPVYDPFEMERPKHRGYANITFKTHMDSIRTLELLKKFTYKDTPARPNLSRFIFADNSESSVLIKTLEKKKSKQNKEIELMRKMIDIKEKVKLLESNLSELRSKGKNRLKINSIVDSYNNNNNSNNNIDNNINNNNNNSFNNNGEDGNINQVFKMQTI